MLARLGMLQQTVGNDALCGAQQMPILKKSQYMLQMLYPVPQSTGGSPAAPPPPRDSTNGGTQVEEIDLSAMSDRCTTAIGESTLKAMEYRMRPATGEDAVFLLWQWVDCCVGVTP
jgi:conjugal transfer pilus assembly protein TraU